jgi:hypothetical protein
VKIPSRCKKLLIERIQHRWLVFHLANSLVAAVALATVTFGPLEVDLLDSTTPPP